MKKVLLLLLVIFSIAIGFNWSRESEQSDTLEKPKVVVVRFALVSDSENENDLLEKALDQAKGAGVNFVIGLGDWSSVGTVDQLSAAKQVFNKSGLDYYVTVGDHDLWDSRDKGNEATVNFRQIFGESSHYIDKEGIQFIILNNSDIYKGIDENEWTMVREQLSADSKLRFFFSHKTPFHPQSAHIMGETTASVAKQAKDYLEFLENNNVDGFFSGDLHFFAQFNSPSQAVKMTTVGAVNSARNFQGPRFAIVTVYDDYTWEVSNIEIR